MGNGGTSPSARWAADPSGRHAFRFWDGERWTGHVSDSPFAPAKAPDTPQAPVAPEVTEAAEPVPVPAVEASDGAPEPEASDEPPDEPPERGRRQRRQKGRRRKAFWLGALTGAAVVSAGVAIAVFALGVKVNTSNSTAKRTKAPSTTTLAPTSSLATTTTTNAGRPPAQVRVEVINASATANAAGTKAVALSRLGYKSAGLADAPARQGTAVQCKPGFETEAVALSKAVGPGTTVEPFPNPPPAGSTNADCVVVLGK